MEDGLEKGESRNRDITCETGAVVSERNAEEGNQGDIMEHAGAQPFMTILFIHLGNTF